MKIYNWDEVRAETGVTMDRIKYAVQCGRLDLPKGGRYFVISDEGLMQIIRYFKDKPRYTHVKNKGDQQ